ncbi:cytochrome c [Marinobacter salinisoli]|uniref:Cytochrome c n=1 Tax=Marinobacter salinisoli TaxID=2769486 RepID=A0ABX7MRX0_9GAMM|nr:cytochrome c [Marinobacter salinisoli]QSP95121.1 cytochrome c [Marinobacter salinisoli]
MIKHAVGLMIGSLVAMNGVADEQLEQGKKVFTQEAQPSCTICHTLSDAGSAGAIGPNLDELAPSVEQVQNAVRSGVGVMPAFADSLSSEQIEAVARYVASVTGGE